MNYNCGNEIERRRAALTAAGMVNHREGMIDVSYSTPPVFIPANLGGIYAITNTLNGNRYIGSAQSFSVRWARHQYELSGDWHHCSHLQRAWNKYGPDAFTFTILEVVEDRSHLIAAEQRWIDELRPEYNLCRVAGSTAGLAPSERARAALALGPKSRIGKPVSPETGARISAARMGTPSPQKGIPLTEETKAKISQSKKGKPWTDARRQAQEKRHANG